MLTIQQIASLNDQQITALDYGQFANAVSITAIIQQMEAAYPGFCYDHIAQPNRAGSYPAPRKTAALPTALIKFFLLFQNVVNSNQHFIFTARAAYQRLKTGTFNA